MSPQQILLLISIICFFLGAVWGAFPSAPNGRWGNANIISLGLFFFALSFMIGR